MAFLFALESVLKHRKRLEDVAQREFAEAQAAVETALKRLEAMYNRLDEVRESILQTQLGASRTKVAEVCQSEGFITGEKLRIEKLRLEVRALLLVAEDRQEALIACAREKKVLVKLKEKRLAEYKEWLSHIEAKNLDDQTQMRQSWGKK